MVGGGGLLRRRYRNEWLLAMTVLFRKHLHRQRCLVAGGAPAEKPVRVRLISGGFLKGR